MKFKFVLDRWGDPVSYSAAPKKHDWIVTIKSGFLGSKKFTREKATVLVLTDHRMDGDYDTAVHAAEVAVEYFAYLLGFPTSRHSQTLYTEWPVTVKELFQVHFWVDVQHPKAWSSSTYKVAPWFHKPQGMNQEIDQEIWDRSERIRDKLHRQQFAAMPVVWHAEKVNKWLPNGSRKRRGRRR